MLGKFSKITTKDGHDLNGDLPPTARGYLDPSSNLH